MLIFAANLMIRFDMRPSNEQPPFTEIAKESLELIFKAAPDDNGLGMKILKSLYGYIYEGNEPDNLNEVESLVVLNHHCGALIILKHKTFHLFTSDFYHRFAEPWLTFLGESERLNNFAGGV